MKKQNQPSIWSITKGIFIFIFLAITLLFLNLVQMTTILIKPFSQSLFRVINESFANYWWGSVVFAMRYVQNIEIEYSGDPLPEKKNALVVVNHQGMVDVTALFCLALKSKRLGNLKWFVKDIVKYCPGPGWGMLFLGCIFLKRDWLKDRANIERAFAVLCDEKRPFWLINFLEGTRLTEQKKLKSQSYSQKNNLPVFEHVLTPRSKGFVASINALRSQLDGVYDVTIGFPEGAPTVSQIFIGGCKKICIHTRRVPIADMPTGQKEIEDWVWEAYAIKDQLLHKFKKTHQFTA